MTFFDHLKNIFIILIFLQIAPSLFEGIWRQYSKYVMPRPKFALIEIKGIMRNSDRTIKYLNRYFKNDSIKAIMLKMECPGSASGSAYAVFNEIMTLKKEYPAKPIITLVENVCASGGYYIACATDSIVAPACALIGSIGASLPFLFQLQDFIEEYKIKYVPIKAGTYKDATDPFVEISEGDKAMLQNVIDDTYNQFVQDVVDTRKVSLAEQKNWAEGRLFTGRQARANGLIDLVGSASDALTLLKEKALIEKDVEVEWVRPVKRTGIWSLFSKGQEDEESKSMFFSSLANSLCNTFENRYLTKRLF